MSESGCEKIFAPEKRLLSLSKVDDAAVIVAVPPSPIVWLLIVKVPDPCRRLLPMVEVAMSLPEASVASKEPLRPVNQAVEKLASVEVELANAASPVKKEVPETERSEVEAFVSVVLPVKELTPEKVLLSAR